MMNIPGKVSLSHGEEEEALLLNQRRHAEQFLLPTKELREDRQESGGGGDRRGRGGTAASVKGHGSSGWQGEAGARARRDTGRNIDGQRRNLRSYRRGRGCIIRQPVDRVERKPVHLGDALNTNTAVEARPENTC